MLMNRKAEKIEEAKLVGPGTFTTERLVYLLGSLYKMEGAYLDDSALLDTLEARGDSHYKTHLRKKVHCQET